MLTTIEEKPKEPKTPMTSFASINEDLILNILKRLPALSFASAACVSKSWNQICNQILYKPKFASAFSLNPDEKVALEEVVNKVLSEPIRPHFAIANVIGSGVDLSERLNFLATKLGFQTPIIVSCTSGIMGRDAVTDEHREVSTVMLEEYWVDGESNPCNGIILTVGFLPGLKVDAIPLFQPRKGCRATMVDNFVMDIKDYATSISGCASPVGIIMFGDEDADQKPVMEKLDHAMSSDTIIIGDERAQFLYRNGVESRNDYESSEYFSAAVALVFARDRDKPCGEIQFHAALSSGVSAVGPRYKAVSVKKIVSGTGHTTWLTARREGEHEIQDGQRILDDINNELVNQVGHPDLYIGVTEQRRCFIGSQKSRVMTFLVFHGVMGGDQEYLFADGVGIRTGDYFQFYHPDPSAALSSCSNVSKNFRNLNLDWSSRNCLHARGVYDNVCNKELVGGFVFSCCGRGESFFERCNVDSSPFLDNFPGFPMAGIFCRGEIGRGFSVFNADEGQEERTSHCCLHVYSAVYLLVSYTPAHP
ncbi:F-box/LRR-repeat protein At5g63520 isoform X2 [Populus trichocarpa]|uniref:F-box/LRR-repeat protein At5g63520 isoform X2 n=1 Tax=Populus trichocarpa TaxID=3694 RepID=UPI002278D990|nr:F-box/LRR-repeat protein At5g63520 isoform X2 [Populus trichocarpa]